MSEEEKESWEIRFDEKFNKYGWSNAECTEFYLGYDHAAISSSEMKQFISSELSRQREEILKDVRKKIWDSGYEFGRIKNGHCSAIKCIDQLLAEIKDI